MFPGGYAPFALRHPQEHLMQALELAMELAIDVEVRMCTSSLPPHY